MKGSRLPWTKRDTKPARWFRGKLRSTPEESTGQVSTSAKWWEAENSIG